MKNLVVAYQMERNGPSGGNDTWTHNFFISEKILNSYVQAAKIDMDFGDIYVKIDEKIINITWKFSEMYAMESRAGTVILSRVTFENTTFRTNIFEKRPQSLNILFVMTGESN